MGGSIQGRIIIAVVIVTTFVMGALGTFSYFKERSTLFEDRAARLSATSKRLSTALVSPLWDLDKERADQLVDSEMVSREVEAITVTDAQGKPFAARGRDREWKSAPAGTEATAGKDDLITVEVRREGEKIGALVIAPTNRFIRAELSSNLWATIFQVLIVDAVLILFLAILIRVLVAKPLARAVAGLRDIAEGEGDLTAKLDDKGRDEIAELGRWFNSFVGQIATMVKEIGFNANRIGQSGSDLTSLAGEMRSGAATMSQESRAAAASATEIREVVGEVSAASSTATGNLNSMATALEQMSATIGEIAKSTEKARTVANRAVTEVGQASGLVTELGEEAREINKVTEVISEISEQTKLLALNATIEAARAGEAGKGFAVVASEIKELARQTARSTQDISDRVSSIQTSVGSTVEAIEKTVKVISEVNDIVVSISAAVEEQSVTVKGITSNVSEVFGDVSGVNERIGRAAEGTRQVADAVGAVENGSNGVNVGTAVLEQRARELATLAQNLQEMVKRFKT